MAVTDNVEYTQIEYPTMQRNEGRRRVSAAPALTAAQLEELMARFRERFGLTDA